MKDKSPVEQLRDKVAELLTELLDFAEPFIMIAIVYGLYQLLKYIQIP
ncbi:hypothetical protein AALT52_09265 [Ligilactobacillus faecis]|uniref:Uncharacterized protein n=1 Tax=Ligilactobacillus faecis TaxID=762833 RepID=A0ABV4DS97_9LACO